MSVTRSSNTLSNKPGHASIIKKLNISSKGLPSLQVHSNRNEFLKISEEGEKLIRYNNQFDQMKQRYGTKQQSSQLYQTTLFNHTAKVSQTRSKKPSTAAQNLNPLDSSGQLFDFHQHTGKKHQNSKSSVKKLQSIALGIQRPPGTSSSLASTSKHNYNNQRYQSQPTEAVTETTADVELITEKSGGKNHHPPSRILERRRHTSMNRRSQQHGIMRKS